MKFCGNNDSFVNNVFVVIKATANFISTSRGRRPAFMVGPLRLCRNVRRAGLSQLRSTWHHRSTEEHHANKTPHHPVQPRPVPRRGARSYGQRRGGDAGTRRARCHRRGELLGRLLPESGLHAESGELHDRVVPARHGTSNDVSHAPSRARAAEPAQAPEGERLYGLVGRKE